MDRICYIDQRCEGIYDQFKPIKFQIGQKVFSVGPPGYLVPSEDIAPDQPGMCIVAFQPSPDVSSGAYQIFLLGDTFLRNFYSVFDYDNHEVGLGVNVSSKDWSKIESA